MSNNKYIVELSEREMTLIQNMLIDKVHHGGNIEIIKEYLELYDKLIEVTTIN